MRAIVRSDSETLAAMHASGFEDPWSATAFGDLIATGAFGVIDDHGFVLLREGGGEAEILTIVVTLDSRRLGIGRRLVEAGAKAAAAKGAEDLFLEVASDNEAALSLYRATGFEQSGLRRGYYRRANLQMQDALIFRRPLNSPQKLRQ